MEVLDKIVGQGAAKKWIEAALATESLPQTLVFVGPGGVGKATTAMAIANFLHGTDRTVHPDTFLFSERLEDLKEQKHDSPLKGTVDDMIRFLQLSPFSSKHKVVILDDAEALTDVAQNALLKTLEEPRADSVIILIAENEQQLLPTILSRSTVVRFDPLARADLEKVVGHADEEIFDIAMGSAGVAKQLAEDEKLKARAIVMRDFWAEIDTLDTEAKFAMTDSIKEREEAMWFVRVGMGVWHAKLQAAPNVLTAKRLERLQESLVRIKGNANQRIALEALLLVF